MDSIHTIDCHYAGMENAACAYLLTQNGKAIFIEANTTHAVPYLLEALEKVGLSPVDVEYLIITHVHLDHAGGSSALLAACPNAILLAHPRAAKHMINPSRLVESTKSVYGEANFDKLYGQINPIPEERVRIMKDREALSWHGRTFTFYYTKGHANHHFCIHDSESNGVFTGDSFGISYPALENGGRFIFPTTTPTDFNHTEAKLSLDLIVGLGAETAYLTHFGGIHNLREKSNFLKHGLDLCQHAIEEAKSFSVESDTQLIGYFQTKVREMIATLASEQEVVLSEKDWKWLWLDIDLNSQGLLVALRRNLKV